MDDAVWRPITMLFTHHTPLTMVLHVASVMPGVSAGAGVCGSRLARPPSAAVRGTPVGAAVARVRSKP